jgi:trigger factor
VQAQAMKVDRERVQSRLQDLAAGYPNPEEARRAYLQNQDAMRQIESAALEDQVVDFLVERASVTERTMTFTELTGFGREEHQHEHEIQPEGGHDHQHEQADGT